MEDFSFIRLSVVVFHKLQTFSFSVCKKYITFVAYQIHFSMKVAIIGVGNLGKSFVHGFTMTKKINTEDIYIIDPQSSVLEAFSHYKTFLNLTQCNEKFDIVLLALKPDIILPVVQQLSSQHIDSDSIIVSVAAGITIAQLTSVLPLAQPVVRLMPSIAVEVGESTLFYTSQNLTDATAERFQSIFSSLGLLLPIPEKQMAAATALSGCGIAYALRYFQAAKTAGIEIGFAPQKALEIILQTVKGAIALQQKYAKEHPEMLIEKVTTPGGLTIKGLNTMEKYGFSHSVREGIKASNE